MVFSCFFWHHRSTKHRKYRCFWRLGSQKPRYLRCFLPLGEKNHGIYSVLRAAPSKHWYLHSFQPVARSSFSMQKLQKHCKLQCFGRRRRPKKQQTSPWKLKKFPLQCLTPMRLFLTDSRCKITRTTPKPPTCSPCCTLGSADIYIYLYIELCRTV